MRFVQGFLIVLVACGGSSAVTPATPPKSAPAPVAPPAPAGVAEEVGPDGPAALSVPAITLSEDPAVIAQGKAVYDAKGCGACHQFGAKLVGPDLKGLTDRRTPTWVAKMIKYPEVMTKTDPVAKGMFRALMVQMTDQGVAESDLTPLVSYLHSQGK
jgi:mono/diheme cytochrome c family protein